MFGKFFTSLYLAVYYKCISNAMQSIMKLNMSFILFLDKEVKKLFANYIL